MLSIEPSALTERDTYKFLIGSIVPRPIAFVTTQHGDVINAAPFSYFNVVDPTLRSSPSRFNEKMV